LPEHAVGLHWKSSDNILNNKTLPLFKWRDSSSP
jgi:hypothetical protein